MNPKHVYTKLLPFLLFASMVLGMFSCIKEGGTPADDGVVTQVRLVVGRIESRAGEDNSPDPIRRLRVYAFNQSNERIGYLFQDGLNIVDNVSLPMSLDKQKDGTKVWFYVLANDRNEWGLDENTSRAELKEKSFTCWRNEEVPTVAPMVNNTDGKDGCEVTLTGKNWQNVDVDIQHIVGRLRLLLNKEGNGDIVVNRAAVYHRPDNYLLFTPSTVAKVTFENNSESVFDEFVTERPVNGVVDYEVIGQTYLAPNAYGTKDPNGDTYIPIYQDSQGGDGKDKAYRLSIDYTVGGASKHKDVYLPQVLRNQSIDVQGTLKSGSLDLAINVKDWEDGGESDLNYSDEFSGSLNLESGNPVVGDKPSQTDAYAVVYGEAAGTRHDLTFELDITKPIGATWTANVSNGGAFEVVKADGSAASGIIDGNPVRITVRPTSAYEVDKTKETELYVTIINNNANKGEQIINSEEKHPGTKTRIRVRQISLDEWNQIN